MALGKQKQLSLACELAADRVVAARSDSGVVSLTAIRTMGAGALDPSLEATNIARRDIVRTAVQEAMAVVASRSRDVIAVLPDAACRVSLLDFDAMPEKREDADAVVRFRLKKSLPFDVADARVSFQVQPAEAGAITVVAAVVLNTVLEEYESILREAGYSAGVVLPSILAALGQVDASEPTLVVKVDSITASVAIVDRNRLVLVRTLDNPVGTRPDPAQLAEDVYPSVVFYQDTYGKKIQKILVGGLASIEQANAALEELTGIRAQELVSASRLNTAAGGQRAALSGVVGALASN